MGMAEPLGEVAVVSRTNMRIVQTIVLLICMIAAGRIMAQQITPNAPPPHNLMPVPASIQFVPGRLRITATFQVAARNYSDARLVSAISRMMARLSGRTGITFNPAAASDENQATLVVDCAGPGKAIPSLDENE